jgi:hypothetical protein
MKTKDWFCSFDLSHLRRQSTTLLLANLFLGIFATRAETDATWRPPSPAAPPDWNNPNNWSPRPPTPGPTGTATFDVFALAEALTFSQNTTVGDLRFLGPGPGYLFFLSSELRLTITSSGIEATPTNAPTFNVTSLGNPALVFESGTADPAIFNVTNTADMEFHGMSAAGNATINARPGQTSIRATVGPRIT